MLTPPPHPNPPHSSTPTQCGAGVDCLWLAKRRGNGQIVKHLMSLPVIQTEIVRFETALVAKHAELEAAEKERNRAAEEEVSE